MTVMLLKELSAATPEARPSSAPACQGLWVTAGCVEVSSPSLSVSVESADLELMADLQCYDFSINS